MRTYVSPTHAAALICAVFLSASNSFAQAPAPTSPDGQNATPDTKSDGNRNMPLSEKLNKNEGVLVPPRGVDPKIHKDPPAETGDRMPVIIPPGEPGGNQQIQPK